jgi:hypothetical protein
MITITLFILALIVCAAGAALIVRSEPETKPVPIKRPPLPEHIRRHHAAQDRGDFHR